MRTLELKVPPPAFALFTGALMRLAAWAMPGFGLVLPARVPFAIGLAGVGVLTALSGALAFRRARTTLNPMKPDTTSSLVASGVFAFTRNPMYLGLLLGLTGWAIFLSNALPFIFLPAFVFYMSRFQIVPEERTLASLFGREFAAYKARVRRWL